MSSPDGPGRRHDDPPRLAGLARALAVRLDAVWGGRCLLVFAGAGVALGAAMLDPTGWEWDRLAWVSAAMAALLAASFAVPWRRLPRAATAAFPVAVFVGFSVLGVLTPALTGPLAGLLVATYLYIGLTQRQGSSLWAIPAGGAGFVMMNGGFSGSVAVRLIIGVFVWTTLLESLAAFTALQRRLKAALVAAAHVDALTGVPNRRDLHVRLLCVEPGDALVLCDLDHFKALNDTRGHQAGDHTLAEFGSLLRTSLRAGDYGARYGGEEFVLILPGTDDATADAVVDRLRLAWRLIDPTTTFSAGIARCRADQDAAATLAAADAALYRAKAAGRDTTRAQAPTTTASVRA